MVTASGIVCVCESLTVYVSVYVQCNMHRCLKEDLSMCPYVYIGLKIRLSSVGSRRTGLRYGQNMKIERLQNESMERLLSSGVTEKTFAFHQDLNSQSIDNATAIHGLEQMKENCPCCLPCQSH